MPLRYNPNGSLIYHDGTHGPSDALLYGSPPSSSSSSSSGGEGFYCVEYDRYEYSIPTCNLPSSGSWKACRYFTSTPVVDGTCIWSGGTWSFKVTAVIDGPWALLDYASCVAVCNPPSSSSSVSSSSPASSSSPSSSSSPASSSSSYDWTSSGYYCIEVRTYSASDCSGTPDSIVFDCYYSNNSDWLGECHDYSGTYSVWYIHSIRYDTEAECVANSGCTE